MILFGCLGYHIDFEKSDVYFVPAGYYLLVVLFVILSLVLLQLFVTAGVFSISDLLDKELTHLVNQEGLFAC